jgi:PAS domain S-box-containing protein
LISDFLRSRPKCDFLRVHQAAIANWPVHQNMQSLSYIKENKISELLAVENVSAAAGLAVVLIENSAGSGSNLSYIEAEKQKSSIHSQLAQIIALTNNPNTTADISQLQSLTDAIFLTGQRWVEAVIQMNLKNIAPFANDFNKYKQQYSDILHRVQKTTRENLNTTLTQTIRSSKRVIFFTILVSLIVIPLVVMLQIKLTIENTELHRDLEQTLLEKSESLTVIEEQNRALSAAKRHDQETMAKLRASEQRTAQIINFLPDPTFVIDGESKIIAWNRAIEELTGKKAETMLGKGDYEYALPFYGERRPVMIDLVGQWGDEIAERYRYVKKKGAVLVSETKDPPFLDGHSYFMNTAGPLYDGHGQRTGAIESIKDITELRQTEKELTRLQNYLANIIDSMPSIIVGVDVDGLVTLWNRQAKQSTGLTSEAANNQPLKIVLPQLAGVMERVHEALSENRVVAVSKKERQDGNVLYYEDITIYPLMTNGVNGAVIRVDDVTERVRLEDLMIQSEKMLMVGGLAAGMAHEINNPLAGILQNTQVIQLRLSSNLDKNREVALACGTTIDAVQEYARQRELLKMMDLVVDSSLRAAKIVRDMLSFSHKGNSDGERCDLATLLDDTLQMASKDFNLKKHYDFKNIRLIREYDSNLPAVFCQKNRIQQVFFNILNNGAQAMSAMLASGDFDPNSAEKGYQPTFTLRTYRDAGMARVEIADNGPGIKESLRQRIFEPFFTTKPPGVGTGLGMSVSYFIVTENHGGTITVESEPGNGASFIIHLPIQTTAEA